MQTVAPDSLRRVLDEVFAGRGYDWRDESGATVLLRRWREQFFTWLEALARDHPDLFRLLIWLLVAVLGLLVAHAVWILVRTARSRPAGPARATVPPPAVRDAAWYAGLAARLRADGRLAAAMQADFVRLVLELDARNAVRFHPGRNPREYLNDLAPGPARADFAELIADLYRFGFGGVPVRAEDLDDWTGRARADRYAAVAG